MTGTVKTVIEPRGFGFITPDARGNDVFFHFTDLLDLAFDEQLIERAVSFDEVLDQQSGKLRAKNIRAVR